MEQTTTHVIGINPEELTERIVERLVKRINRLAKNKNPESTPNYFTREEISKKLNVSCVTLYRWEKRGILKRRKIGGKIYYKLEEIEAILEQSIS
ncbi:helix-turn-helix domain-containing protein [[Muricauda] lutisoli]|uniref:Helix-turn-helix domain-containing protein n=1 Tax=[Muricauda] lutisoli TaxID=2816035 RepID=A0ABS3EVD5_9FLAO|nr:helix-turn-helix domain-containing protein [[Muricauda] lutisoli]MBO0330092.1 helix-turn-helix domain-containing protein [[Muricauda] lutisoli]